MPESAASKQNKALNKNKSSHRTEARIRVHFSIQTMGIFVLLIIALAFAAGLARRELALTLTGAVFLAIWLYCLFMTLFLALIRRGQARQVFIRVSPGEVSVGDTVEAALSHNGNNFTLPGSVTPGILMPCILLRCRVLLQTKDGRQIRFELDPSNCAPRQRQRNSPHWNSPQSSETSPAKERGAYFSEYDEFAVFDALGFFRFAYRIPVEAGKRLLACPHPAQEPTALRVRMGGAEAHEEFQLQRSDNLVDHRPYVPGDDPRRINWKLFGHGGELFVREGEPEPPPHSNILLLIDTQCDSLLYNANSGRRGVDLLCENALAAALGFASAGMDVMIGFTGSDAANSLRANTPSEFAAALAMPFCCPLSPHAQLPRLPDDRGVLVFALPRANAEPGALGRLVNNQKNSEGITSPIDIIFLYTANADNAANDLDDAAETCAAFYNRMPNVRARAVKVMA